jgi:hypothetical protein
MNTEAIYQEYVAALDACVELSGRRAFGHIDGTLTNEQEQLLRSEYAKALFRCVRKRNEWMTARTADLLELDD